MKYNVVHDDGVLSSVTVFDGTPGGRVANKDHPNFQRIMTALEGGSETIDGQEISDLFDVSKPIANKFAKLSERVVVSDGRIYFDGDPLSNGLVDAILRFYEQDNDNFQPLVLFLEKIATNPDAHSMENLYRWLSKHRFGIHEDGDFIAYKGVAKRGDDLFSQTAGTAMVNGKTVKGQIPNTPGTVIEMPRSKVAHNPQVGCSTGLHAGSWRYARGFTNSGTVLEVKINPRDVVSVPTDCNDEKLRVSRYQVIGVVHGEQDSILHAGDVPIVRAKKVASETRKAHANYDSFNAAQFHKVPFGELRWLAKQWGVRTGSHPTKPELVRKLARKAAAKRRKK